MLREQHLYDAIVIGACGLYGSSIFYHAAEIAHRILPSVGALVQQTRILGIDQFQVNHSNGSSHGESRITRVATGEGPEYIPIVRRSHELWRKIEAETNQSGQLCHLTGGLIIGSNTQRGKYHGCKNGFLQETRALADEYTIPHQSLSAAELRARFPQFKVEDHESGYFEMESMGFICPDKCIKTQLDRAQEYGAELHTGERLLDFTQGSDGIVRITTIRDSKIYGYQTKKLIFATGPWTPELLKDRITPELNVYRQTIFWFEVADEARENFAIGKFPPFIWDGGPQKGIIYGFPIMDGNYIKIGSEKFLETTTPDLVNRTVGDDEVTEMYEKLIKPNFVGITSKCHQKIVCLYTIASEHRFIIDYLPNSAHHIIVVSACSGHGAKHSAAIGEAVAQLSLLGQADIDVIQIFGGL